MHLHLLELIQSCSLFFWSFEVPLHAHVLGLDSLVFDCLFVTLLEVALDTVEYRFNILFFLIVESNELQLDLMQHQEAKDQDLRDHVLNKWTNVLVLIYSELEIGAYDNETL